MDYNTRLQTAASLRQQADALEEAATSDKLAEAQKDKTMQSWRGYQFESSSGLTEEFALFAKCYRRYIKNLLPAHLKIASFNRGHFYISGFIKNENTGKYAYFSISDVRWNGNGWWEDVLIRTAAHDSDYTGGRNQQTTLPALADEASDLTA